MKAISPIGLSATGSGPRIFRPTSLFILFAIIGSLLFTDLVQLPFMGSGLKTAGWIAMWIGIVSWVVAIAQFAVYFPKGRLITNGIFSVSRNPIYSSWILLILPGLALVINNWIFLLAAVVMLVAFLVCISDEEEQMRSHFGADYTDYCKKVRRLI